MSTDRPERGMEDRLGEQRGRIARRLSRTSVGNLLTARRDVVDLRARVAELEREVQECRRLNRRLAELTDIVQELLVPIAQRDENRLREQLDRYAASL